MAVVRQCDRCLRTIGAEKYAVVSIEMVMTFGGEKELEQTPELCFECLQKLRIFLVPKTAMAESA